MPVMDVGDDMTDPTICPTPFDSGGDPSSMLPPAYVDCALPSPCDEVRFVEGQDFDLVLENPAALTCVLDALADGAPAEVVLKTETYISGETTIVRAYDMGRAEISYSSWFDSAYDASRTPYEGVAGYDFSACDGQQAWSDVWPCIQAGFSTCGTWAADEDLCPAGP